MAAADICGKRDRKKGIEKKGIEKKGDGPGHRPRVEYFGETRWAGERAPGSKLGEEVVVDGNAFLCTFYARGKKNKQDHRFPGVHLGEPQAVAGFGKLRRKGLLF